MAIKIKKSTKTEPTPVTPEQIHEELKKLHVSIQVLMAAVTKLHEEIKTIHGEPPKRKWFGLAGGKQSWWS